MTSHSLNQTASFQSSSFFPSTASFPPFQKLGKLVTYLLSSSLTSWFLTQFSHETASQVAYVLTRIKNLENSDSISLIGFSNTQLEKAVKSHPGVLLYASLDNTIKFKPKIKIFQDLGFSANDIAEIIYKDLWSLYRSADRVIPSL
ncbi:uncharacterized protein Fot_42854 [Forsythia ovata]|uniref:Uncharacterized protein n=1 Tax=Forsythia ovata TaxID=205694 RepID=A0ABD1RNX6_9LAMI